MECSNSIQWEEGGTSRISSVTHSTWVVTLPRKRQLVLMILQPNDTTAAKRC